MSELTSLLDRIYIPKRLRESIPEWKRFIELHCREPNQGDELKTRVKGIYIVTKGKGERETLQAIERVLVDFYKVSAHYAEGYIYDFSSGGGFPSRTCIENHRLLIMKGTINEPHQLRKADQGHR